MFAIGMFDLGGVDDGMTGAKEGEEQGEDDGETGGGGQGGPDGIDLELGGSDGERLGYRVMG